MPIIPVLTPEQDFSPPRMAVPDVNDLTSAYAARNAQGIGELNTVVEKIQKQRQELKDATDVSNAYMTGLKAMDANFTAVSSNPAYHLDAPDTVSKLNEQAIANATKGLRPNLATHVQRELTVRQLGYSHKAQALQSAAQVDSAKATLVTAQDQAVQDASRRDISDSEAMSPVLPHLTPEETFTGTSEEQATSGGVDAFGKTIPQGTAPGYLEQSVNAFVAQGLLSKTEGAQYLLQTREKIARGRALGMMLDTPEAYRALSDQETKSQGSTFLRYLSPEERARLAESADTRIQTKKNQTWQDEQRQRVETERMDAQLSADVKGYFFQQMNDPKANGAPTQSYLDLALQLRALSPDEYQSMSNLLKTEQIQGGPTDPATVKRLSIEVNQTAIPAQQRLDDLTAAWKSGKIPHAMYVQYAGELSTKASADDLGKVDPILRKKTVDAQTLVGKMLYSTNVLGNIDDSSVTEKGRLAQMLEQNMYSKNPEDPQAMVDREMPGSMARIKSATGTLAESRATAERSSLGMPGRTGSIEKDKQAREAKKAELQQAYRSATTQADRGRAETNIRQFMELEKLEQAIDDQNAREQIVTNASTTTPGQTATKRSR